jgi:polysaccharide export outer membrane protein
VLSTSPAFAQAVLVPRASRAPDYVLGVGDQITVHVTDLDDIPDRPFRIDPNGFVDVPLVGRVQASGETLEQFKNELSSRLKKYIDSPQISINLSAGESQPVTVVGSVNAPGIQQLQGPRRLIEVISLAGGLKADAGSTLVITRQLKWGKLPFAEATVDPTDGVSTVSLQLDSLMSSHSPRENVLVEPNDVISVSKAEIVYVLGNVRKAGGFTLSTRGQVSLLQALSLAEGLDSNAAASKARIVRPAANGDGKAKEIPVDITKITRGEAEDIPLYANDVLYVPNSALKASAKRATEAVLAVATGVIIYHP